MEQFSHLAPLYFEEMYPYDIPDVIWHYTNLNALLGILGDSNVSRKPDKKMSFWFTRSDCLNDKSEGLEILKIIKKASSELLEAGEIDDSFHNVVCATKTPRKQTFPFPVTSTNDIEEDLQVHTAVRSLEADVFICCFSKEKDLLEMWRYYAKSEDGYCLKIQTEELFSTLKEYYYSEKVNKDVEYVKLTEFSVLYSDSEKTDYIKSCLSKAYKGYKDDLEEYGADSAEESLKGYLHLLIRENQFRFKNECFSSEKEFRIVAYRPKKKLEWLENDLPKIKYRQHDGMLIPYIEIASKDALRGVQIGPQAINEMQEKVVGDYLADLGYNDVEVTKSNLPIRF